MDCLILLILEEFICVVRGEQISGIAKCTVLDVDGCVRYKCITISICIELSILHRNNQKMYMIRI